MICIGLGNSLSSSKNKIKIYNVKLKYLPIFLWESCNILAANKEAFDKNAVKEVDKMLHLLTLESISLLFNLRSFFYLMFDLLLQGSFHNCNVFVLLIQILASFPWMNFFILPLNCSKLVNRLSVMNNDFHERTKS